MRLRKLIATIVGAAALVAVGAAVFVNAQASPSVAADSSLGTANGSGAVARGVPAQAALRYVIVPGESKVAYKVGEVFFNQGNRYNVAVGTTGVVNGEILVDPANMPSSTVGPITVDISQFVSDNQMRDNRIRREWLESARFPIATFVPTAIEGLLPTLADGQEMQLQITGDLTIKETTRPTTFQATATISGDTLTGFATTQIKMTDFGFDPPNIANILRAENDATIEFNLVARQQG